MPKDTSVETPQTDDATANAATGANTDTVEQSGDTDLTPEAFAAAIARAEAAEAKVAAFELRDQKRTWAAEIAKDSLVPPEALRGDTKEEFQYYRCFGEARDYVCYSASAFDPAG